MSKRANLLEDNVLKKIIHELMVEHGCHTVILYGSRARGDYTATSDYDVAGVKKSGQKMRIARFDEEYQVFYDLFIYPEDDFSTITDEHLCMADGIIISDQNHFGKKLLTNLNNIISSFKPIPEEELQVRRVWYKKMLARASIRDLEGKYRHIWAIFTLLEDYFAFRGLRYFGPKKAFKYLETHDPDILASFNEVLSNTKDTSALERLIKKIV